MKILIGLVDNHPMLWKQFVFSLMGVIREFDRWNSERGGDYELQVAIAENGGVDDMRNTIAETALLGGFDYIFWMDTDQTFPIDALPRLLSYCERDGREAASGLYTYKTPPFMPHVYPCLDEAKEKFKTPVSFPIEDPMVIAGAGFGCLLMKTSVLKRVERPYFTIRFEGGIMVEGEDLPFCKRAKMDMILDPKVLCGHLKVNAFGITDFLNYNGIDVVDGWVKPTPAQHSKMLDGMRKLFGQR